MKKVALISAILFFLVYFATNTFLPEDETNTDIRPVVDASPVSETIAVDQTNLNRVMEAEIPSKATADADVYSEREVPSETEAGYYLIVASFNNLGQAQQVARKYTDDFNADIIILPPTPQGYYRVSYGRYATPGEADAVLPAVRKTINPDAWVYSIKKPR